METKNNAPMVYLKDILFSIAYRWKRILAVSLVLAIAFALYNWATYSKSTATADKDAVIQEQYQREEQILLSKIDVLTAGIAEAQEYVTDSILMQLDPREYYEIALTLFIDTDYQIVPELSYQNTDMTASVINNYGQLLVSKNALNTIADTIGSKSDYVKDVMTVECNTANQTIVIQAQYADQAGAEKFADAILACFDGLFRTVEQTVATHTYTVLSRDIYKDDSMEVFDAQVWQLTNLDTLEEDLDNAKLELAGLKPPVVSTTPYSVKDAIVPAAVGALAGAFVMVFALVLLFLADPKAYSCRNVRERTNVKIIGCARSGKRVLPDMLWLRKLEGRSNMPLEQQLPLLAANIGNRCEDGEKLIVSGSADPVFVQQVADYLAAALSAVSVVSAGDILTDPAALSALAKCDNALLVEQCSRSQYAQISSAQELIADNGKQVFGCILIDG